MTESSLFTQLSSLNGFIHVDLESGEELARIEWPEPRQLPPGNDPQANCHGVGLNPDNTEMWATSSMLSQVRAYSVFELEPLAEIDTGPFLFRTGWTSVTTAKRSPRRPRRWSSRPARRGSFNADDA